MDYSFHGAQSSIGVLYSNRSGNYTQSQHPPSHNHKTLGRLEQKTLSGSSSDSDEYVTRLHTRSPTYFYNAEYLHFENQNFDTLEEAGIFIAQFKQLKRFTYSDSFTLNNKKLSMRDKLKVFTYLKDLPIEEIDLSGALVNNSFDLLYHLMSLKYLKRVKNLGQCLLRGKLLRDWKYSYSDYCHKLKVKGYDVID